MTTALTETSIGDEVVDVQGDTLGVVSTVTDGLVYVAPDPDLAVAVRAKLGWPHPEEEPTTDHALTAGEIDAVTGDEVRLRYDL